ncbi:MAG TPA: FAD-dependent oxidoreductase [Mesotoga sp.]|nr:FAD-dependent oxidoreductase [Mesotoga sp.]
MIRLKKDVVIVGAGISGVHAAIAAGKAGLDVLLVEREGSVGGISTLGLCNPFMRFWLDSGSLVGGIFEEILKDLARRGGLLANSFDSEIMKIIYFEKLKSAGVSLVIHSIPIEVERCGRLIKSVKFFSSQGSAFEVEARYFVDATGDATLSYMAGAETFQGDESGSNQAMTLMFTVSGIDYARVREDIKSNGENFFAWVKPDFEIMSVAGYFEEIERARKAGYDKLHNYFFFIELPGSGRASVNTTHSFDKSAVDPFELSEAVTDCMAQTDQLITFAREYVRGFEKSGIEKIATLMGVRESRRVRGLYVFSGEDVKAHRKFPDGVVRATYGIDVHNRSTQQVSEEERKAIPVYDDYYEIPLRSLISGDLDNLAIIGRCFSSDFSGQSAARVMPTVAGMGQAIGRVLYQAISRGESLSEIAIDGR